MPSIMSLLRAAFGFVALTLWIAPVAPASSADAKLVAGTLTCKGRGGIGLILGSKQTLRCNFASPSGNKHRPYVATITKIGVDIGFTGESTMVWTVLSTTTDLPGSAMEGTYGGVTAGASVGIGGNANALIGGSSNSVVLQPISVQGQTGLNLAVGIAGLTLRSG